MSNITQVPASPANYTAGRLGYGINGVIIHTMVCSLPVCDATFANPSRGASAHYGVACDGSVIHQYVAEGNIAWHCGRFYPDATHPLGNANTIGIEHCDNGNYNSPRPDGLYLASSNLVREVCKRYGIPIDRAHIRKHNEVSVLVTGCPDALDINRIVAMAAGVVPVPITTTEEDMIYVGPIHPKAATFKTYVAGHSHRERSTSSPVVSNLALGASVVTTGYCYSTSSVASTIPVGSDFLWWQVGTAWVSDAILDTSGLVGAPGAAIPAAEPIELLFALAGSVGTKGDKGDQGIQGIQGLQGIPGPASTVPGPKGDKGDVGTVPEHHHSIASTGPMVP